MESSGKIGTLFLKKNIVCILGRRGKIGFLWGVWLAGKKTGKVQRRRVGSVPGLQWYDYALFSVLELGGDMGMGDGF